MEASDEQEENEGLIYSRLQERPSVGANSEPRTENALDRRASQKRVSQFVERKILRFGRRACP
jgi:hypothetical protein